MRALGHIPWVVLWPLEIALLAIWIATVLQRQKEGLPALLGASAVLVLLTVLYFAEGLELAVADLRDKDPEQVDPTARAILTEIKGRSDFFFAQRQVFVVAIISFVTLITAYDWIYIPFLNVRLSGQMPFWFSFVFTSITVLWFAQVTPKTLAVHNSELFLTHSRFLWPLIKLIALVDLPAPSHHVVWLVKRYSPYSRARRLRPSGAAHYDLTTHFYGYALDRSSVEIVIGENGSAKITRKYLFLFLHGSRPQLFGYLDSDSSFVHPPRIDLVALHTGIVPERFETLESDLNALFEGRAPRHTSGFSANLIAEWPHDVTVEGPAANPRGNGERFGWRITSGRVLPEGYWSFRASGETENAPLVALVYAVSAEWSAGAVSTPEDSWIEQIAIPCRHLSVSVSSHAKSGQVVCLQGCLVTLLDLNSPLPEETNKYTALAVSSGNASLMVRYPRHGAFYSIHWRLFPAPDGVPSGIAAPQAPRTD